MFNVFLYMFLLKMNIIRKFYHHIFLVDLPLKVQGYQIYFMSLTFLVSQDINQ
jgi:hypothetical protein